jgi:hypothetical protein
MPDATVAVVRVPHPHGPEHRLPDSRLARANPVSCPKSRSGVGNRSIPSCGVARQLNIGRRICALLAACRMGASGSSVRQLISGTEHYP